MIGRNFGSFAVTQQLGEGGMGQVYLARDPRLDRDVALKVLPESFAQDPQRMARFEREAKLLASLDHPGIATVHGIEEAEGRKALVMEYIPGVDLSKRIRAGALPWEEAAQIAVAIARALEAAHASGVVHRDLKPANVILRSDGVVKVLDFGLAKSMDDAAGSDPDLANSPTLSFQATQMGVVLGTAAYMSPEQARGRAVDARSDVFAFGCTLFEMLAGEAAFAGEDVSEILASVIKGDVRWAKLPKDLPAALRQVLERCLQVRADERYQAIGDARIDLVQLLEHPEPVAVSSGSTGISMPIVALLALLALAIGAGATWLLRPSAELARQPVLKYVISSDISENARISPDGLRVAYEDRNGSVWVRRLDQFEPQQLDVDPGMAVRSWAPDSRTLILDEERTLWKIDVESGSLQQLCQFPPDKSFWWGGAPYGDDEILVSRPGVGIFAVPLQSGNPRLILASSDSLRTAAPWPLPNGAGILFSDTQRGTVHALVGSETREVFAMPGSRVLDPRYDPASGHLIVRLESGRAVRATWAVAFSPERLEPTGEPFPIAPVGQPHIANNGTLLIREVASELDERRRLVWVARDGSILEEVGAEFLGQSNPVLSPDERRVVFSASAEGGGSSDLQILDLRNGASRSIYDDSGSDTPRWWGEDDRIGYSLWTGGIRRVYSRSADGADQPTVEFEVSSYADATRDGGYLAGSWLNLYLIDRQSGERRELVSDGQFHMMSFSPDGRYLAYETDRNGLAIGELSDWDQQISISRGEVSYFTWDRDGASIYYLQGQDFYVSSFDASSNPPVVGTPQLLFTNGIDGVRFEDAFAVARDGRLLMVQSLEEERERSTDRLLVIQNWFEEFR